MIKSSHRKPAAKASETIEEYLELVPSAALRNFNKLRATIRSAVPRDSVETISYRIPAFKRGKILVWFAAFSKHCSLFPTASVIKEFRNELQGFSTSKGTIQFSNDEPLPTVLIKKIVKRRVAQTAERKLKK